MRTLRNVFLMALLCAMCIIQAQSQIVSPLGHSAGKEKSIAINAGLNSMDCNLHTTTIGAFLGGEYIYQKMDAVMNNSRPYGLKIGGNARFSAYTGSEKEEKYGRSYTGLYASIGGDIGYSLQLGSLILQPSVGPQLILPLAVKKEGIDAGNIDAGYGFEGKLKFIMKNDLSIDLSMTRFSNDLDPYGDINENSEFQVTYNFAIGVSKALWVKPVSE